MSVSINDIKNRFNAPKSTPSPAGALGKAPSAGGITHDMDQIYKAEAQNWYSAKPYGFKTTTRSGSTYTMFLPISPSNLTINTNFATNIIPTLYGTIEEHSDVRYFDISIEGTTGMAPQFVTPGAGDNPSATYSQVRKQGRSSYAVNAGASANGFFAKTLGAFNKIKDKAADILTGSPKAKTGLVADNSGYVAFHNLYRFLLQYKKDAAGVGNSTPRQKHPLTFFNYKDNNQYDVVVKSFTMRRSADNPMLYFYSIQLRAYNIRPITSPINEDLTKRLKDLGLNGVDSSSLLGDIKSISNQAKSIIGAAVGGISVLGR